MAGMAVAQAAVLVERDFVVRDFVVRAISPRLCGTRHAAFSRSSTQLHRAEKTALSTSQPLSNIDETVYARRDSSRSAAATSARKRALLRALFLDHPGRPSPKAGRLPRAKTPASSLPHSGTELPSQKNEGDEGRAKISD